MVHCMIILGVREICWSVECVLWVMLKLAYRRITYAFCATLGTVCSRAYFDMLWVMQHHYLQSVYYFKRSVKGKLSICSMSVFRSK